MIVSQKIAINKQSLSLAIILKFILKLNNFEFRYQLYFLKQFIPNKVSPKNQVRITHIDFMSWIAIPQ